MILGKFTYTRYYLSSIFYSPWSHFPWCTFLPSTVYPPGPGLAVNLECPFLSPTSSFCLSAGWIPGFLGPRSLVGLVCFPSLWGVSFSSFSRQVTLSKSCTSEVVFNLLSPSHKTLLECRIEAPSTWNPLSVVLSLPAVGSPMALDFRPPSCVHTAFRCVAVVSDAGPCSQGPSSPPRAWLSHSLLDPLFLHYAWHTGAYKYRPNGCANAMDSLRWHVVGLEKTSCQDGLRAANCQFYC